MIIAKIGNYEYALESLKDADALLQILSRATEVDADYRLPRGRRYVVVDGSREIGIFIVSGALLTADEARELIKQTEAEARE